MTHGDRQKSTRGARSATGSIAGTAPLFTCACACATARSASALAPYARTAGARERASTRRRAEICGHTTARRAALARAISVVTRSAHGARAARAPADGGGGAGAARATTGASLLADVVEEEGALGVIEGAPVAAAAAMISRASNDACASVEKRSATAPPNFLELATRGPPRHPPPLTALFETGVFADRAAASAAAASSASDSSRAAASAAAESANALIVSSEPAWRKKGGGGGQYTDTSQKQSRKMWDTPAKVQ